MNRLVAHEWVGIPRDILEFCLCHDERQDTLEGIAEWWLMEHRIDRTLPQVRAALELLVEDQMMIQSSAPDGKVYYRVNRSKLDEIKALLAETRAT